VSVDYRQSLGVWGVLSTRMSAEPSMENPRVPQGQTSSAGRGRYATQRRVARAVGLRSLERHRDQEVRRTTRHAAGSPAREG
jgi:hypothetical protein